MKSLSAAAATAAAAAETGQCGHGVFLPDSVTDRATTVKGWVPRDGC